MEFIWQNDKCNQWNLVSEKWPQWLIDFPFHKNLRQFTIILINKNNNLSCPNELGSPSSIKCLIEEGFQGLFKGKVVGGIPYSILGTKFVVSHSFYLSWVGSLSTHLKDCTRLTELRFWRWSCGYNMILFSK